MSLQSQSSAVHDTLTGMFRSYRRLEHTSAIAFARVYPESCQLSSSWWQDSNSLGCWCLFLIFFDQRCHLSNLEHLWKDSENERFASLQLKRLNMSLQSAVIDIGTKSNGEVFGGRHRWLFHFQLWDRVENNMVNRLIKDDGWRDCRIDQLQLWLRQSCGLCVQRGWNCSLYLSHHDAIERVWHHSNDDLWWQQPALLSTGTVRPRSSMPWYNTQYTALILCP